MMPALEEEATRVRREPPSAARIIEITICRELEKLVRAELLYRIGHEAAAQSPLVAVAARRSVDQLLQNNLTSFMTPRARTRRPIYEVHAWIEGDLVHVGYIQADATHCQTVNGPIRITFVHLCDLEEEAA